MAISLVDHLIRQHLKFRAQNVPKKKKKITYNFNSRNSHQSRDSHTEGHRRWQMMFHLIQLRGCLPCCNTTLPSLFQLWACSWICQSYVCKGQPPSSCHSFSVHECVLSRFSCVWLFATLWTVARQAPLQAGILGWVSKPSSRGSSWPRDQACICCGSCITSRFFTAEPLGKNVSSLFSLPVWELTHDYIPRT